MPRYRRDHLRMLKSSLPPTEREMAEYPKMPAMPITLQA